MSGPIQTNNHLLSNIQEFFAGRSENENLTLSSSGFDAKGKVGTFFTSKTSCRNAANAVFNAIKLQYGAQVADELAPQMSKYTDKGKPLSIRNARTLIATAAKMSDAISVKNENIRLANLTFRENLAKDNALDTITAKLFADFQVTDDRKDDLLSEILTNFSRRVDEAIKNHREVTYTDLKEVAMDALLYYGCQEAQRNVVLHQRVRPEFTSQMAKAIRNGVEARLANPENKLSAGELCRMAGRGELPEQKPLIEASAMARKERDAQRNTIPDAMSTPGQHDTPRNI